MANVLCLDFDDTLIENNLSRELLERFAADGWQDDLAAYDRGEITVEQYNARALDRVDATREELEAFAREAARPRPGLVELVGWASGHEWQVAVVSNGFDLCIEPVVRGLGLDRVVCHAGRVTKPYRWRVVYQSPRGIEIQGGFKLAWVRGFQEAGDFVAYAGDGASDVEAARAADVVFARSTLLERLDGVRDRLFPFETLFDVLAVMEREAERWAAPG